MLTTMPSRVPAKDIENEDETEFICPSLSWADTFPLWWVNRLRLSTLKVFEKFASRFSGFSDSSRSNKPRPASLGGRYGRARQGRRRSVCVSEGGPSAS